MKPEFVVAPETKQDQAQPDARAMTAHLAAIYYAVSSLYNLQVQKASRPRVYNPHSRQSLAVGDTLTFPTSTDGTDWLVSVEQSTTVVALAVHISNGKTMTPVYRLSAGDTVRFPAITDFLVLENVGANAIGLSVIETNDPMTYIARSGGVVTVPVPPITGSPIDFSDPANSQYIPLLFGGLAR